MARINGARFDDSDSGPYERSNKGDPLPMPQGRVHYSEGSAGFTSGELLSALCSAVEILLTQWREYNKGALAAAHKQLREPNGEFWHMLEKTRRDDETHCEMITDKLKGILEAVTTLGIKPLEVWISGRIEQEDM